ncbi:hypothetical protein HJFPF1_09658 [Paramyrothecium foliicola]|nr:hypothetical protein HJFPF1_09658 [Paramyrothecium foliicola]
MAAQIAPPLEGFDSQIRLLQSRIGADGLVPTEDFLLALDCLLAVFGTIEKANEETYDHFLTSNADLTGSDVLEGGRNSMAENIET